MRKIFTLLATLLVAIAANAQLISFTEEYAKGTLDGKEFGDAESGFLLKLTDNGTKDGAATPKLLIDVNNCYFGTLEDKQQFAFRLKTGGKSSSTNAMTLIIPADGTLKIYARTGSNSATDRNIAVTQDGTELLNHILLESEAVSESYTTEEGEEKTRNIYPVLECKVAKGTASITYPVNAVNIYGIELVADKGDDAISYNEASYSIVATEKISVNATAEKDYEGVTASFADQLPALLAAVGLESATTENFIQVDNVNVGYAYNTNDGWHGADGSIEGKTWGSEEKLICIKPWSEDNNIDGSISYIGCIDTAWKASESHIFKCAVINDGKAAVLEITINFIEKPASAIGEPTTELSKLEIVQSYTFPLDFVKGKSNEGKTYSTTLKGIYEALGCTAEDLDAEVEDYIYTPVVVAKEEKLNIGGEEYPIYAIADEMKKPTDAAGGAWFGVYYNKDIEADADGNVEVAVANAPKNWASGNNTYYTQNFKLNNGEFSFVSGQFANSLEMDKEYPADLYIINGSKAVKVTVVAKLYVPESIPFAEMTSAGSEDIEVTADVDDNYTTKAFTVDVAKVYDALGCTADDIDDFFAFASEGEVSDNHTEGGGGYYFNKEGFIASWGASSAAFVAITSIPEGQYKVGQMPGTFTNITEDETVTFPFLYMYGDKYYTINLKYTVKAPAAKEEGFEYTLKATEVINRTIIPGENWLYDQTTELDHEYIASIIGTTDYTLYGEKYTEEDGWKWTKNTNCSDGDSKGAGFWYKKNVYEQEGGNSCVSADGWGDNSFGFQLSTSGVISWFQYPGLCTVGESYSANIYLVNEETGDYIKYIINVVYAEEDTPEATVVGTEKSSILVSDDSYDETSGAFRFAIPTDAAYEALGLTDELLESSATVSVPKSSMVYQAVELEESATINANGYIVDEESEDLAMAITIAMVEGKPVLIVDDMDYFAEENKTATVRFAIEYNGNRYNYELTLSNNAEAVGINGISAAKAKSNGKYLENGKIVIVRNGVKYNVAGAIVK